MYDEQTTSKATDPVSTTTVFSSIIEILPVKGHIKKGKYVSGHLHLNVTYLFEADEHDSVHILESENSKVGWLPFDELI